MRHSSSSTILLPAPSETSSESDPRITELRAHLRGLRGYLLCAVDKACLGRIVEALWHTRSHTRLSAARASESAL